MNTFHHFNSSFYLKKDLELMICVKFIYVYDII